MFGASPTERAYFTPFLWFIGLQGLGQALSWAFAGEAFWIYAQPQYWVQPAQTLFCGALLWRLWPHYEWRQPRTWLPPLALGTLALLLWIGPQAWLGAAPRLDGFQPGFFGESGAPYTLNLSLRFLRLVVVVPLVEEIFWRGFLLRWLIDEDFTKVPIGTFQWKSFLLVSVFFMLEHQPADYPAALLTGALFNLVAIRTRSLNACVMAHALTNLLLGLYILHTSQWGFW